MRRRDFYSGAITITITITRGTRMRAMPVGVLVEAAAAIDALV